MYRNDERRACLNCGRRFYPWRNGANIYTCSRRCSDEAQSALKDVRPLRMPGVPAQPPEVPPESTASVQRRDRFGYPLDPVIGYSYNLSDFDREYQQYPVAEEGIRYWRRPPSTDGGRPMRYHYEDQTPLVEECQMCEQCRCCSLGRSTGVCIGGCTKDRPHPPIDPEMVETLCRCTTTPHQSWCPLFAGGPRDPYPHVDLVDRVLFGAGDE